MVHIDINKDKIRAERLLLGINKICALIDIEDITPEFVMAEEIGTKVTKSTFLCPCGVLITTEKTQELLKKAQSITISSEKCGIK